MEKFKCVCGCDAFNAHQLTRHDVVVDGNGSFLEDKGIYNSENPYGPFTCIKCNAEYEELREVKSSESN
jgi:hypothetical protein